MKYTEINAKMIDKWVDAGWEWGVPITHEQYVDVLQGNWSMLLTPTVPVPKEWYPDLKGKRVLGLASGGGQQMPIFAALGAECTLLDYSERQIASDLAVAARERYGITTVRADMTLALPFADDSFDLIFHPVSNCYIEDVLHVWRECYRILRAGGKLMAGMNNGFSYLFDEADEKTIKYRLPFNPLQNRELLAGLEATDSGIQFSHTLDEQIRGQLKVGFKLLDLYEDTDGSGLLHDHGVPTFWATLAVK
ncbi:MAG: putative methyltransferase YcgJ [Firmicutes bacterium]|nr:putative methyltransferase YcgJ [candidate division NPL-UPA2 bacterium]